MGYLDKEKTDALNREKRERKIGNLGSPKTPSTTMPANTGRCRVIPKGRLFSG